jgi:molybdate transport system substrate-binding protein
MWTLGRSASIALIALLAGQAPAEAAELIILSGNGARPAVRELAAQFESRSGHKVVVRLDVNPEVKRRIEAGEEFDVAILNPPVLDELIGQGRIVAGTRTVLGRAGIGVGVRAGAARPDLSSVPAFTRTLLAAKSVAYPGEGASGRYFVSLVDRLGIVKEMQGKLRPMPADDTVEVVARGEAELVVVVASRISGVPGVDLVGGIPPEMQTWIGFAAGIGNAAKEPEAAREMLRFFTGSSAASVLRAVGIEPFVE